MGVEVASVSLHIPTQAAGTDDEWYIAWPHPGKWVISAVEFAPATAVATDGTDYVTVNVTANDANPSTTWNSVASHHTNSGGTAPAAFVLGTTIEPTVTPRELRKGYQIKVAKVKTGAGKIVDGTYTFSATKVN